MSLKAKLMEDMKAAMKEKDTIRKNAIQMVRAAILQVEKDKRIELNDEDIISVIGKEVKKRKDALSEIEKSNRQDMIDDLKREIDILMNYLPEQLSDEELEKIIDEVILEVGASSMKDMGKVMGAIAPKVKGRADNRRISVIVKQKLN
ncbi:GatB/YqeY domain-containing protein [Defluviitalea phaphyphila]|uniref:GatB/YqeY domain-containing protein n=1 Tax=Defluviitalea phaphyphila TaxID=1473580 RepID=UPI000730E7E1|nr:GatB/YqeY domain-containing protein [Defluviitalea phaphyphila]